MVPKVAMGAEKLLPQEPINCSSSFNGRRLLLFVLY